MRAADLPDILTSNKKGTYILPGPGCDAHAGGSEGRLAIDLGGSAAAGRRNRVSFGRRPLGTMIYMDSGAMAVHIAGSDRAAGKLLAYAAEWHIAGGGAVHEVKESTDPKLRGVRLNARAELDTLTGAPIHRTIEKQGADCRVVAAEGRSAPDFDGRSSKVGIVTLLARRLTRIIPCRGTPTLCSHTSPKRERGCVFCASLACASG